MLSGFFCLGFKQKKHFECIRLLPLYFSASHADHDLYNFLSIMTGQLSKLINLKIGLSIHIVMILYKYKLHLVTILLEYGNKSLPLDLRSEISIILFYDIRNMRYHCISLYK
jgi:hypothetical protein